MGKRLPSFIKITEGEKVALIDSINKVCLGVSKRIADNLEDRAVQEKIYPIWKQQACCMRRIEDMRGRINTAYLMVTRKCNMNCEFCAINANDDIHLDKEIRLEHIKKNVIPFLKKCKPHKLIITGGEPLIKENIIEIVQELSQELSCPITLQSNGLAADTSLINRLSSYITEIDFSTRHMFESEERQRELMEHINMSLKNGIKVVLSFIYEKRNINDLYKLINIAAEYDLDVLFNVVSSVGRAKDYSNILTELEHIDMNIKIAEYILRMGYEDTKMCNGFFQRIQVRDSCGGYGRVVAIFPEGNIYMCQCMENAEVCMGNINVDAPETIMNTLDQLLYDQKIKERFCVDYKEVCKNCEYRYICGGKCVAKGETGNGCYLIKSLLNFMLFHYNYKDDKKRNLECYIRYMNSISAYLSTSI